MRRPLVSLANTRGGAHRRGRIPGTTAPRPSGVRETTQHHRLHRSHHLPHLGDGMLDNPRHLFRRLASYDTTPQLGDARCGRHLSHTGAFSTTFDRRRDSSGGRRMKWGFTPRTAPSSAAPTTVRAATGSNRPERRRCAGFAIAWRWKKRDLSRSTFVQQLEPLQHSASTCTKRYPVAADPPAGWPRDDSGGPPEECGPSRGALPVQPNR